MWISSLPRPAFANGARSTLLIAELVARVRHLSDSDAGGENWSARPNCRDQGLELVQLRLREREVDPSVLRVLVGAEIAPNLLANLIGLQQPRRAQKRAVASQHL